MVGAIVLPPTDAASQKPVVGLAHCVVVARARAPRDTAVQHCLEYLGSEHPEFELEGSARLVVQFEGVLPEATPRVAYAPVDLDGQVGIMVDVSPEVYKLVRLVINRLRSASSGVFLILSPFLRFGADLRGMRTFAYMRLSSDSGASKGGRRALTQRMSRRSACFVRI